MPTPLATWFRAPRLNSQNLDELKTDQRIMRIKYGLSASLALGTAFALPAMIVLSTLFPVAWLVLPALLLAAVFLTFLAATNGTQLRSLNRKIDRPSADKLKLQLDIENRKENGYLAICSLAIFVLFICIPLLPPITAPLIAMMTVSFLMSCFVAGRRSKEIKYALEEMQTFYKPSPARSPASAPNNFSLNQNSLLPNKVQNLTTAQTLNPEYVNYRLNH